MSTAAWECGAERAPERVSSLVRHKGYAAAWQACAERVKTMCDEPTPFVSRHVAPTEG